MEIYDETLIRVRTRFLLLVAMSEAARLDKTSVHSASEMQSA